MGVLLIGHLLYTGDGRADSWQQNVSSRIATEFDTNPAMSASNPGGVWRGLFEPNYLLVGKIGESEIRTGLGVQIVRSSNTALSPDQNNPSVFLNWLRPSDAGEFGVSTRLAEVATRDAGGVDATGQVPVSSTRTSRNLSGSWSKELSGFSTISADGTYERVSYKGGGAYTDYSTRSGGLRYSYVLSETITPFIRVSGNKYTPAGGGSSSSLTDAMLGLNWKSEFVDGIVQAGRSRVVGGNSDTQGSATVHYAGQRNQLTLTAGRTISPSGLGGFVKADQVTGNWSYALSEYVNTGIDMERRKNLPTVTSNVYGITTVSGAWIEDSLSSFWKIRTSLQRRTTEGGMGGKASSNLFGLSFTYDYSNI